MWHPGLNAVGLRTSPRRVAGLPRLAALILMVAPLPRLASAEPAPSESRREVGRAEGPRPDPLFERSRGGEDGDHDPLVRTRIPDAWAAGATGRGITVAVIDTGVDTAHEDLAGQCLPGFNAIDGTDDVADSSGHGTMVAGAIAALRDNGRGYVGVAPGAKILPVKVGDARPLVELPKGVKDVQELSPERREAYFRKEQETAQAMTDEERREYDQTSYLGPPIDYDVLARGITWAADHGAKALCVAVGGDPDLAVRRGCPQFSEESSSNPFGDRTSSRRRERRSRTHGCHQDGLVSSA